ncbi:putative mitochondrial protein [Andalucia godoyi]|uniref:Putative mitochondrial protein n=1 Tax=Andalucia godoyi TaxID=505711 RepID=A0A8K0AIJ3_ANDGO|nr:putative mitochondrial protein [Andalucia godoyi]|eukprot:ANDGO_00921.mRNA.1 putative mitochondrial protein
MLFLILHTGILQASKEKKRFRRDNSQETRDRMRLFSLTAKTVLGSFIAKKMIQHYLRNNPALASSISPQMLDMMSHTFKAVARAAGQLEHASQELFESTADQMFSGKIGHGPAKSLGKVCFKVGRSIMPI